MLALVAGQCSSYVMPGLAPTVAPRMSAPAMEMTDPRFPPAGKGVLPDGRVAAIPFLVTPAHLDGSYAGDNVRRSLIIPSTGWLAHSAPPPREPLIDARPSCDRVSTRSASEVHTT